MVQIPILDRSDRSREFDKYADVERARVVYEYLFNGLSHRALDKIILGLSSKKSRGWQSMGILHYLGIRDDFKSLFKNYELYEAIAELAKLDEHYKNIAYYLSIFNSKEFQSNDLLLFRQNNKILPLIKAVGSSQFTDGVRINKPYHQIFNPKESTHYTSRGSARAIRVLFNNKIFDADYRYEGQTDEEIELQSIRFKKDLKAEFKAVFPFDKGEFVIALGRDLNHFLFINIENDALESEDAESYPEGRISYRKHKVLERNPKVIKKAKKDFFKKHGFYACQVCGFRFDKVYGERGEKFIEGHHVKLVSEMEAGENTQPKDIVLLCSNCHRMIHRKPRISVEDLKNEHFNQ
jgi:5-methylcytosine-specific restriction enzyme A